MIFQRCQFGKILESMTTINDKRPENIDMIEWNHEKQTTFIRFGERVDKGYLGV